MTQDYQIQKSFTIPKFNLTLICAYAFEDQYKPNKLILVNHKSGEVINEIKFPNDTLPLHVEYVP